MEKDDTKSIQKRVIFETFKNKEFTTAVAQAIGDNLVKAIRKIDDWNLEYEIINILKEAIFTDDFKEEIKNYAKSFIKDNEQEIKDLVKTNMSKVIAGGIVEASEKIGELLTKKITDIKSVY